MGKTIFTIIFIFLTFFWVYEPPHDVHSQVMRNMPPASTSQSVDTPVPSLQETDSLLKEKAKLLNSKVRIAERNRDEIDDIHSKSIKAIKKQQASIPRPKRDSIILVEIDTDTIYFPDIVLIEETIKGKTFWGRWWRTQVKLIKDCTIHKKGKNYYKRLKGKIITYESKNPPRNSGTGEEVPK